MRDFLTFRPKEVLENKKLLFECSDEMSPTGSSLLVRVEATHAGIINGNHRFYRPDRMQDSVSTWTDGFAKPVLAHHQEDSDALGRVLRAKYQDLSYKYAQDYPIVRSTLFYNTDAKERFNLFESVDWIAEHLMSFDDYRGLGFIELGLNITNPDAIRKVLNDEYLTVSVGFDTDQAFCSVCHQDWAEDDRCEHKLGTRVDGKKAFLISGYFDYHEMSYINFPADPFAGTIDKGRLEDNLNRVFFLGLPVREQATVLGRISDQKCIDAISYESDIQVVPAKDSLMSDKLKQFLEELGKPELTKEKALEIRDAATAITPEGTEEIKLHKRVVSTARAIIRKNGWGETKDTLTKEQVEAKVASIVDMLRNMSKEARPNYIAQVAAQAKEVGVEFTPPNLDEIEEADEWKLEDLPEDEREYFKDPDKLYELLAAEIDAAVADGELEAEAVKDAKLSTSARKKLKSGTFCGPNRSFPVPDCAHVVAARRLIGRYKGGGSKERILACVSRKASALGCGGGSKKAGDEKSLEDTVKSLHGWKDSDVTNAALPHLKELDGLHKKAEDSDKYLLHSATQAMLEHWSSLRQFEYYRTKLAEDKDYIVIPKSEHEALQDGVVKAENALQEQKTAADTWQNTSESLVAKLKKTKAAQIVMFRILTGEKGYQNLDTETVKGKIEELTKRTVGSLDDALADIFDKLAGFEVTSPTAQPAAKEVNDNAQPPQESDGKPAEKKPDPQMDPVLENTRDPQLRALRVAYNALGSTK
jgi:hypothetical protein